MITYLVIANGDSNKSYKCNTTHTSKPYIRINEHNYLDLTTETTTGVQLKYKQKTGSSYRTYNTTSQTNTQHSYSEQIPIYSGYVSQTNSRFFSGTDGNVSNSDSNIWSYTQTSLQTNTSSNTSSRHDYGMQPPTTIGNYLTNQTMITNYYSTSSIQKSETITTSYLTTTKSVETFKNRVYIPVQSQSTTVSTTRSSLYTNTTGYSGRSIYNTTTYKTTGYTGASWWSENHVSTTGYSHSSTYRQTTGTGYRSTTTISSIYRYNLTGVRSNSFYTTKGQYSSSSNINNPNGCYGFTTSWVSRSGSYGIPGEYPEMIGYVNWREGPHYTTARTATETETATSRYSTTDYSGWYPDFTAYSTGTRRRTSYYTGINYTANATELTSGYTTRLSSLASSSAAGSLSNTTALTSSGTRTSSSLRTSSSPNVLKSITELTITSTRTSLTNRTSSTDL